MKIGSIFHNSSYCIIILTILFGVYLGHFGCLHRSFSPRQSPVRQTGKQVSRDGSFSSAQNPHYDSLETSEEREEPNFARLNWNLDLFLVVH